MAINFEFYENPDPTGTGEKKYHARVVTIKTVSTDEIASRIHKSSSLTVADIKAVLVALSEEVAYCMGDSERVHLEGLGYFQPTVTSTHEIDPKKTRAQSIFFKSVKFRADQELKNKMKYSMTYRSEIKNHSAQFSNKQIENKLNKYFQDNRFITRKEFQMLCLMTPSTASRHIKRLVEEGKLKNINTKRQPVYELVK